MIKSVAKVAAYSVRLFIACGLWLGTATAADLTGTVTNKTSSKASVGDDVVMLKLSEGMQETARTKTDAQGKFTVAVPNDDGPHLVRVTHQGVNYFKPAPSGTTSVQVDVYDAGKQVQGVSGRADIMRVQSENGQLQVMELFVVQNNSTPPDRKSTRLNSSHMSISYAVFCLKKKKEVKYSNWSHRCYFYAMSASGTMSYGDSHLCRSHPIINS